MDEEIEVTPSETEILATEDADEIDEIAEQLAVSQIISEERHAEILQELESCQNQLESLSQSERAENPLLTQIAEQLVMLRAEVESLKSSMDSKQNPPTPSPSAEMTVENPAEPNREPSISEPFEPANAVPAPPAPRKKHRFI